MRISDWSSDVCSSVLHRGRPAGDRGGDAPHHRARRTADPRGVDARAIDRALDEAGRNLQGRVGRRASRRRGTERLQSEIGRSPCRERVCQYVKIRVIAGSFKKKKIKTKM